MKREDLGRLRKSNLKTVVGEKKGKGGKERRKTYTHSHIHYNIDKGEGNGEGKRRGSIAKKSRGE